MKRICITLAAIVLLFALSACGSDPGPSSNVEYDTVGGFHAVVSEECPSDYAAAAAGSIAKLVPGSDTSQLSPKDFIITEYDNGMASLSFQNVIVDGNVAGGEIYLEFTDDGHNDYKTHYLQVANKEYLNDGINLADYEMVE